MIRAKVILNGVQKNSADLEDQAAAESWYSQVLASGALPHDHSVQYEDISSQIQDDLRKKESDEAIALGADLMSDIRALNKKKLADGAMDEQQFSAMLLDSNVEKIERALWNGSFVTAKALINGLSAYYTSQEKAPLIAKIDAFLSKYP